MPPPCPYCSVAAEVLWESEHAIARRAAGTRAVGHVVVSVKRHVTRYFDASAAERAELWRGVDAVKRLLELEQPTSTYGVEFDDSRAHPEHVHVNVIPLGGERDDSKTTQLTTSAARPLGSHLFRDLERRHGAGGPALVVDAQGTSSGSPARRGLARLRNRTESHPGRRAGSAGNHARSR